VVAGRCERNCFSSPSATLRSPQGLRLEYFQRAFLPKAVGVACADCIHPLQRRIAATGRIAPMVHHRQWSGDDLTRVLIPTLICSIWFVAAYVCEKQSHLQDP